MFPDKSSLLPEVCLDMCHMWANTALAGCAWVTPWTTQTSFVWVWLMARFSDTSSSSSSLSTLFQSFRLESGVSLSSLGKRIFPFLKGVQKSDRVCFIFFPCFSQGPLSVQAADVKYCHFSPLSMDAMVGREKGRGGWVSSPGFMGFTHVPIWCQLLSFSFSGYPPAAFGFHIALGHPQGFSLLWPSDSSFCGAVLFQGDLIDLWLQVQIK